MKSHLSLKFSCLQWSIAKLSISSKTRTIAIASITVTAWLLVVRQLGALQGLETIAFDWMMRSRPDPGPDPRLLVVEITEADIAALQQWPISDRAIAQLLQQLQKHQPMAIGIDIVRDFPHPPGSEELVKQLQQPNTIAITTLGNDPKKQSVSAPLSISPAQVGFNDFAIDPDGRVRRNLIFARKDKTVIPSFSLQLTLLYLKEKGIVAKLSETNQYQLGKIGFPQLQTNSGGYQKIDARAYQILLNYRSPNVAKMVTLTQAIAGEIEPDWVKDKIVIIGVTAPSLKDVFFTPYSPAQHGRQMAGVSIHAQMASQILSTVLDGQPLFWFWSEKIEILWIFIWAIAGGIFVAYLRNPLTLFSSAIAGVAVLVGISYGLFLTGGWIPVAAPVLAFILTGAFGVVYQMQVSWQQQQMVMKLLGQQTSPEIANALWNDRDRLIKSGMLPWQTLTATVLFTDLKNFSTFAETKSPDELMTWLNPYLSAMTDEVLNHNGIVNKFTGDGIMAVFGVPIPRTTPEEIAKDAQNAVNCALAMGEKLQQFNQKIAEKDLPLIQMRVGIYTGLVTVGSLGGKNRLEYGVIGDTVNTASRLESCEKDRQTDLCRVLIGGETFAYLQDKFEVELWGPLPLKGKRNSVEVYRVIRRISR